MVPQKIKADRAAAAVAKKEAEAAEKSKALDDDMDGYWAKKKDWEPLRAAMEGSSYYKLPNVLRWFSGNIGYHHIHHLSPTIPNYRLKKCFDAIEPLQTIEPVTLSQSLSCFRLKLWDEELQKMVAFP